MQIVARLEKLLNKIISSITLGEENILRIAICDDKTVWSDFIKKVVEDYMITSEIDMELACFDSGESLLKAEVKFDLIFLDEEMSGLNGLETAMRLRKFDQKVKIVFVTSHTEIMQKAFRVNAYRFVKKDFLEADLIACLKDFLNEVKNEKQMEIDFNGTVVKINQMDIIYISAIRNGTFICCNKEQFVSKLSLKDFEDMLDKELFYRCHRKSVVNISYIDKVDKKIILYNEKSIEYSRRNKGELLELHFQYLFDNAR